MQNTNLFPFNNDDNEHAPITPGLHAAGGATPWHDVDYDNPASIGPVSIKTKCSASMMLPVRLDLPTN